MGSLQSPIFRAPSTCEPTWLTVQEATVCGRFWKDLMWIENALRVHHSLELSHKVEFQGAVLPCGVVTLESPPAVLSGDRASEFDRIREQASCRWAHQITLTILKDEGR